MTVPIFLARLRRRRAIRQRCEAVLAAVPRVQPFSARNLCHAVVARWGWPIMLSADAGQAGISGQLEIRADGAIVIHYDPDPTADQDKAILHELSHVLLGHLAELRSPSASTHAYLKHISPERVRHLRAGAYSDRQEQEAETLASLIRLRDAPRELVAWTPQNAEAAEIVRRWTHFYEDAAS